MLTRLSVCYEMAGQIKNTLRSLLPPYQRDIATEDDVIEKVLRDPRQCVELYFTPPVILWAFCRIESPILVRQRRSAPITALALALTHLALAVTHLALALTHLALAVTHLALALTHLALAVTHLALALTHLALALTHLALALTRLVLVLVRWLLVLDSQAQQMVAKDGTPESTALPRQRAQWSQQSIAKASRWRELDRIWRADPVLLFLILIFAPTQLHLTRIRLHLAIYFLPVPGGEPTKRLYGANCA